DGLGLVRQEMLLVHAIDLEHSHFEILRSKRPAFVYCPKSNAKFAHGVARVPEICDTGIAIALGTDSVASNNVVDTFEEMRAAIFQQRARRQGIEAQDAQSALRLGALGGPACVGLARLVGRPDDRPM